MKKNITNQNAETGTPTLRNVVEDAYSLNDKMEQAIIKVVNENGGLVRTDNEDCQRIYGLVEDEESGRYEECQILAITTLKYDNELSVLFGNVYDKYMLDGMTNDEILECTGRWYLARGGFVLVNATLLSICENLEEHIDHMLDVEDEDIDE